MTQEVCCRMCVVHGVCVYAELGFNGEDVYYKGLQALTLKGLGCVIRGHGEND